MRENTPKVAELKCPCGMIARDMKFVSPIVEHLQIDDIYLCGGCGRPSIVTLLGLRYMTDEEFNNLSPDEQKDLNFAQRAIKRQLRNN